MRKSEKILREYVDFKDINQSEPVELLPLTIEDCMEEYAIENGKKYFIYGIFLGLIIGFLITIAFIGSSNENAALFSAGLKALT